MTVVRIGVIGCGTIAQIQHLPALSELPDQFEVCIVCDVSPSLSEYVGNWFHVPTHVTDYREVLESDVDAVILCHNDPKTEVAVAAFEAGKHVFIEKPMCYSLKDADAIISAAEKSGKVGQVGYMKLFESAFEIALQEVSEMDDVTLIRVNQLHPSNSLHTSQYQVGRFDDHPKELIGAANNAREAAIVDAIGHVSEDVKRAFYAISGSMIHDLYGIREMFGVPSRIVSTSIWNQGNAISTNLQYPNGATCIATWVELSDLWDFEETLEVCGKNRRVLVSYPTGFSRGVARLTIKGVDDSGRSFVTNPRMLWDNPFKRELRHFYSCITTGCIQRASVKSARDDVSLIIDITNAYNY